jgi:hypothetical protein
VLDGLLPASLRALKAHLGDEQNPNPDAWKAAGKILELRYGPAPTEPESVVLPSDPDGIERLTWQQMRSLAASLITVTPNGDTVAIEASGTTETTT